MIYVPLPTQPFHTMKRHSTPLQHPATRCEEISFPPAYKVGTQETEKEWTPETETEGR